MTVICREQLQKQEQRKKNKNDFLVKHFHGSSRTYPGYEKSLQSYKIRMNAFIVSLFLHEIHSLNSMFWMLLSSLGCQISQVVFCNLLSMTYVKSL